MTEQNTTHTENLHKRLSMMENEINELNEILQENLDNSHKINYLNDDVIINDQHDQEIDDLKNVIINDKIDIMDDLEKAESPEPEQKEAQKVNNNWAVYTNQEGRRIHEIPVMQKVKELEQNPTSPVKEMSYKRSPTKINTTATGEDEKMVAASPTKSKTPSISEQQMIMPPTPKEAVAPSVKEEHKELSQPLKEVIPPKVLETPVIEDQTPKVEESSVIKDQTPKVLETSVIVDQTPKVEESSVIKDQTPKADKSSVIEEPLSKAVSPKETPLNDYKLASTRKTKNPFRVVSVSKGKELSPEISNPETFINVDPAKQTFLENVDTIEAETAYEETEMPNDIDILLKLYDHICEKINKLGSEIEYVNNIIESRYSYSLTYDELKQFKKGKVILQRYLDKKYKQKYELENKISLKFRQLKLDDKMNSSLFFGNK